MALQGPPTPIALPKPPKGYANDPVTGVPRPDPGYDPGTNTWAYNPGGGFQAVLPTTGRYTQDRNQYDLAAQKYGQQLSDRELQRQALEAQMRRAQQGFETSQRAISGLSQAFGGGTSGGGGGIGTAPPVQYPQVSVSAVPDASALQSAECGRAKAQAGAMGGSAVRSLREGLAERGILGGGTEARGLVTQLAGATNPLSDLNVAQQSERMGAIQHAQDLAAGQAGTQFGGNIAQRGQDIQAQQAAAQLAQRQREQQQQLLISALSGLSRSY